MAETADADGWIGRMLIIVWVRVDRVNLCPKADVYPQDQQRWIGLHGWQGVAAPVCGLKPHPTPVPTPPKEERTQNTSPEPAARMRGQKRPWVDVEKELFPDPETRAGKKAAVFAFQPKVQVCRATDAFHAAKLPKLHIGQELRRWAKQDRPRWYFEKDFGSAAPHPSGGPPVWCVTRRVAHYLFCKK